MFYIYIYIYIKSYRYKFVYNFSLFHLIIELKLRSLLNNEKKKNIFPNQIQVVLGLLLTQVTA